MAPVLPEVAEVVHAAQGASRKSTFAGSEAETGSGKTVAYLLPMLVHAIAQSSPRGHKPRHCRCDPDGR